jgi:small subunit ribosomal protein S12
MKTNKKIFKLKKPQIKGITTSIFVLTPKKPNSALRKVAKVKVNYYIPGIKKDKTVIAYIPGENHTIAIHNIVLLIPKKVKDLPGIRYKVLRGKFDSKAPIRSNRRSLYGVKKIKK